MKSKPIENLMPRRDKTTHQKRQKSQITREKLILSAEKLFGNYGIDSVSLRTVSEEAGQKNNTAVQYHFGGKARLVQAILEYRESILSPVREQMLSLSRKQDQLSDAKILLKIMFKPYLNVYKTEQNVNYFKFSSVYLIHQRPKGVPHPIDRTDFKPSESYRACFQLLREKFSFLGSDLFDLRIEAVAIMFFNAFIQHDAREKSPTRKSELLADEMIEMMYSALASPPFTDLKLCTADQIESKV